MRNRFDSNVVTISNSMSCRVHYVIVNCGYVDRIDPTEITNSKIPLLISDKYDNVIGKDEFEYIRNIMKKINITLENVVVLLGREQDDETLDIEDAFDEIDQLMEYEHCGCFCWGSMCERIMYTIQHDGEEFKVFISISTQRVVDLFCRKLSKSNKKLCINDFSN